MLGARLSGSVTADFISTKTHFNFLVLFRSARRGGRPLPHTPPNPPCRLLGGPHGCGLCDPLLAPVDFSLSHFPSINGALRLPMRTLLFYFFFNVTAGEISPAAFTWGEHGSCVERRGSPLLVWVPRG